MQKASLKKTRLVLGLTLAASFAAVATGAAFVNNTSSRHAYVPPPEPDFSALQPKLTAGEVSLAKGIFGDQINTQIVTKHYRKEAAPDGRPAEASGGTNIIFFGTQYHSADYSRASAMKAGYYGHEMTHIWQQQNNTTAAPCKQYRYSLWEKYNFASYCREQQATIIEDYIKHFLHPEHVVNGWTNGGKQYNDKTEQLLMKVVEDQFPQARITRLSMKSP